MYKLTANHCWRANFCSFDPRPVLMALLFVGMQLTLLPWTTCAQVSGSTGEMPAVTHKPKVFERLWGVYPNKEGKEAARQAWNKLQLSDAELDRMRAAFPLWLSSAEWAKERGKHVPPLSRWLEERIWEKEPPPRAPMRISEVSSFLIQPFYFVPRLAFALSGAIVAGIVWPFDHSLGQKVWDTSIEAPWAWHEFIDPS